MTGYRIKQTIFMVIGFIVFWLTCREFVGGFTEGHPANGNSDVIKALIIWFGICLGGSWGLAWITGGSNDQRTDE